MLQAAVEPTESDVGVSLSSQEPKGRRLKFVSYSLIWNPNQREATLKVEVDGEVKTFSHSGGVGPVDAMCTALQDLVPGFHINHCGTEESRPGSDAPAKAHVEIQWGGLTFQGVAEAQDTLDATAMAVIDALGQLRPIRLFTGGRFPEHTKDPGAAEADDPEILWAGFLINEVGGSRGKGSRDLMLFSVTFDDNLHPCVTAKAAVGGKLKKTFEKRYHHEHKYGMVKTQTTGGETCHLFVLKSSGTNSQLS